MNTAKVYIVTEGEYSDYTVHGAFSTRELAELAIAQHNNEGEIEEYELDSQLQKSGWNYYWVTMDDGGNVVNCKAQWDWYKHDERSYTYHDNPKCTIRFATYVYADTPERAIKVANERRAQMKAAGLLKPPNQRSKEENMMFEGFNKHWNIAIQDYDITHNPATVYSLKNETEIEKK
jgi:hypothetical protein